MRPDRCGRRVLYVLAKMFQTGNGGWWIAA
jgi:hypothetical protein